MGVHIHTQGDDSRLPLWPTFGGHRNNKVRRKYPQILPDLHAAKEAGDFVKSFGPWDFSTA